MGLFILVSMFCMEPDGTDNRSITIKCEICSAA
jgi:hypothetical protein